MGNYNGSQTLPFVINATGGSIKDKTGLLDVQVTTEGAISVYGPEPEHKLLTEILEYTLIITTPYDNTPLSPSAINAFGVYVIDAYGVDGTDYQGMTGDAVYVNSAGIKDTTGVYDFVFDDDNETGEKNQINIANNVKLINFDGGNLIDLMETYLEVNGVLSVYGNRMDSDYITVELAPGPYYYVNGQLQGVEPEVSVYAGKMSALVPGKKLNEVDDYTVMFGNNNGVGMATVTITGNGTYTGTRTEEFDIIASVPSVMMPAPAFMAPAPAPQEETTSEPAVQNEQTTSEPAVQQSEPVEEPKTEEPKQGEQTTSEPATQQISEQIPSSTAIRLPQNIQLSRLVASLGSMASVTTPYIIKIEKNNDGVYETVPAMDSVGTFRLTFDIGGEEVQLLLAVAPQNINKTKSITLSGTSFTYGGYEHKPVVTVVDTYQALEGGELVEKTKTLTKDVDYTVTYVDNINLGTATAVITGIGNYTGEAYRSFTITDKQPNDPPQNNPGGNGGGGSSAPTEYKVTLVTEGNGGTLVSSAQTAPAGDTVIVVAVMAKGYAVKTFTATDAKGKELAVTKVDDNSYSFTMPAMDVTVKAVFSSVFVLNYAECYLKDDCVMSDFPDVNVLSWYHDGVHFCIENGITYGYANGYFGPNDMLTRGMYITMLYNMAGRPVSNKISEFGDVDKSLWYSIPIKWAEDNQVIAGYTRGAVFGPNDAITREQMVQIMYNYAKHCGKDVASYENTDISMYSDAYKLSPWAVTAMKWAVGAGVISGRPDGSLGVLDSTTRAEATTVFLKYVLATETVYDHLIFIDVHREAQ